MSENKKYNYPKQVSIVRFLAKAESIRKNPIPFHKKLFDQFGDTFSLKIGNTKHVILSRENEVAEYILQKNQKNFQKSELQTKFISKYLGKGLLTANGDFWLKQRRLIQPAFHKQKMNQLVQNMQQTIVSELKDLSEEKSVTIALVEELLERLSLVEHEQDVALLVNVERGVDAFDVVLDPLLLYRIHDVHVFDADGTAIRVTQDSQQ